MTLVLDAGGVSMLAGHRARARQEELRRRGEWPPIVPAVVLTEVLTGDHRGDFDRNRLLRLSDVRPVREELARAAAVLRSRVATSRDAPSAVDAVVAAQADALGGATVLTSDPGDLTALAHLTTNEVRVSSGRGRGGV